VGTGLGLTVVWNTVKDHNSYIDILNSKDGVTFQLFFPTARDQIPTTHTLATN
jgi:two-component system cell cycle sensor histidine kinase/response regulator CckA